MTGLNDHKIEANMSKPNFKLNLNSTESDESCTIKTKKKMTVLR